MGVEHGRAQHQHSRCEIHGATGWKLLVRLELLSDVDSAKHEKEEADRDEHVQHPMRNPPPPVLLKVADDAVDKVLSVVVTRICAYVGTAWGEPNDDVGTPRFHHDWKALPSSNVGQVIRR